MYNRCVYMCIYVTYRSKTARPGRRVLLRGGPARGGRVYTRYLILVLLCYIILYYDTLSYIILYNTLYYDTSYYCIILRYGIL